MLLEDHRGRLQWAPEHEGTEDWDLVGVDWSAVTGHGPLIVEFADVMINGGCSL